MGRLPLVLCAILAAGASAPLCAGEGPVPGARLRVTLRKDESRLLGALASVDDRSVVLDTTDRGRVTVPLREVARVEASRITTHRWTGAVLGAVGGPAAVCAAQRPCLGPGTIVLAALSGLVGAAIGERFKAERWETVELPALRVTVVTTPGLGVSAAVSIRF